MLDPVERVSEVLFGLLMALTFTGSVSVATDGHEELMASLGAAVVGAIIALGG